jgi:hypothetical protein
MSQCPCGFATDDQLWFASHRAQHLLRRDHELDRARRDLRVSLALSWPGSPVREPILARMAAIYAELAGRRQAAYRAPRCPDPGGLGTTG